MPLKTLPLPICYDGSSRLNLDDIPTDIGKTYQNKSDYSSQLKILQGYIHEMQEQMFAQQRQSLLIVFQGTDTSGKDGTIEHIFGGLNPQALEIHSFKRPTQTELSHDFLWRSYLALPKRGIIGIHNRSYYEEVLSCKVHPEIVTDIQRLPQHLTANMEQLYQDRYQSILDFEAHLTRNGTKIIKFYLHLSKEEQRQRLLERINTPKKHWKYEPNDLYERKFWDDYRDAYEEAIQLTASPAAPWYLIPADNKRTMRLLVAQAIRNEMQKLDLAWPTITPEQRAAIDAGRASLVDES